MILHFGDMKVYLCDICGVYAYSLIMQGDSPEMCGECWEKWKAKWN